MEGLGRVFNVLAVADDVYINLRDAGAVTFVGQLTAGDTFTVTEATSLAGGSAAVLSKITRYHRAAVLGTGAWAVVTQAAGSTFTTSDSKVAICTINNEQLSDGFSYIKCASTSTGTVTAILHDLKVARNPVNLPAVSA
jgi:hypothetical protein